MRAQRGYYFRNSHIQRTLIPACIINELIRCFINGHSMIFGHRACIIPAHTQRKYIINAGNNNLVDALYKVFDVRSDHGANGPL